MKGREIRELSDQELVVKLEELEKEQFGLIFRHKTTQEPLGNPMQIRKVRRDVARLKSEKCERERRAVVRKTSENEVPA